MSANKTRLRKGAGSGTMRRSQVVIAITVSLTVITAWAMLGYSSGLQAGSGRKAANLQAPSPASLNANSPSKEYVYAGARLVATENDYSIFPTYQSFPGNGTNGGTASITVTAPSNANWTASSNNPSFISITSGNNGTGNGTVNYSVATNPGSTIRSGTITVNSQTFTVYQGKDFADVPSNHIFYDYIGRLASRSVTLGCDASNFCPDAVVSQDQMAAFVMRALGDFNPPAPTSQRFNDVPIPPANPYNIFYAFIEQMAVRGIWSGCGNGNYCPSGAVRREEMAAIMIRGRGEFNPPTPPSQRFYDVPPSNQYYNFIDRMAVLNITSGCGTACNTIGMLCYCPTDTVTRGQMAKFLVLGFNL